MANDRVNEIFGANIRKHRLQKNWTQERLADALNVTPQTISKWERATSSPDVTSMCLLGDLFGVSLDSMCGVGSGIPNYWIMQINRAISDPSVPYSDLQLIWSNVSLYMSSFPLNDEFMYAALNLLRTMHDRIEKEKQKEKINAIIYFYSERILDFSRNEECRSLANYNLALYYEEQVVIDRCKEQDIQNAKFAKKHAEAVLYKDMHKTFYHSFGATTTEELRIAKENTLLELLDLTKRACSNAMRSDESKRETYDEVMQLLCDAEEKVVSTFV